MWKDFILTHVQWPARQAVGTAALSLLIVVPWVNPIATGPSPAVIPLLVSWLCVAGLFLSGAVPGAGAVSRAWLAAGLLSCVIGLCQYVGVAAWFEPWMNRAAIGEAFANLRQRNQFATLTNIALAATLWFTTHSRPAGHAKWLALGAACLLAVGNAASSSRTGLVQLLFLGLLAAVWRGWRRRDVMLILLAAMVAYGLAAYALPRLAGLDPAVHGIFARVAEGAPICASRITLWSNVLHLIAQKPWLGWGWGELDYAHYITLYPGERFCDILDNAHNLPLHLAVELGVPAALLICGGLGWLVLCARPWRETDPTRQMAWGVLAMIGLHSLLEYPLWYGPFQVALGLCLVMLWPQPRADRRGRKPHQGMAQARQAGVAVFLIAVCAYAAWDYRRISQIYLPPAARDAAYRENTLAKARDSWLFPDQVRFAELTTTSPTKDNAARIHAMARRLLHYSPEPRVIEKLIESAVLLGRHDEALAHLARYRAAFPKEHAAWVASTARTC